MSNKNVVPIRPGEFPFPAKRGGDELDDVIDGALARDSADAPSDDAAEERPLIVPDGWMRSYVEWAQSRTDAPPVFHLAVGLGVLGTVLGNKVALRLAHGAVYPHLWNVLVAGSSYMRKSTAIGYGTALLADVNPALCLPNQFSTEALIAVLSSREHGHYGQLNASEFRSFMDAIGRDYNAGAMGTLTELYDAPAIWTREIRQARYELRYPCLSLVGGSTIQWLKQQIQADDLAGGFAARLTFWTADRKLPYRNVEMESPSSQAERNDLLAKLRTLGRMPERSLSITPEALARYNEWNRAHEAEDVSETMRGIHIRLETVALKVAILAETSFALGLGAYPQTLDTDAVRYGTALADRLWEDVQKVMAEGLGSTKAAAQIDRIRGLCADLKRKNGGKPFAWSAILKMSHMSAKELREVFDTLDQTSEVRRVPGDTSATGRKSDLWEWVGTPKRRP